ncbi:MAG TPA: DUF1385 domain-containing protein [Acidobacteriota bacterium]|jgi:uncharacterized protein YqhQ
MEENVLVGGQAVIEGVMMRTPNAFAVAVRRPSGELAVLKERLNLSAWKPWLRWPILRGFLVLIHAMILGVRALNFSASAALDQPEQPKEGWKHRTAVTLSFIVALAFGIGLFLFLPLYLTRLAAHLLPLLSNWILFNLLDGLIRVLFFLGYLGLIARMKDIHRIFQYHGAEHKVVHNWEAGIDLSVENARRFSRLHPRCGTSFLMFVMLVSIFVFTLFRWKSFLLLFLSRVILMPLISGISYELIRLSAKNITNSFVRPFVKPGLWLQLITTQEPSDDQLQVAIHSLQQALGIEKELKAQAA